MASYTVSLADGKASWTGRGRHLSRRNHASASFVCGEDEVGWYKAQPSLFRVHVVATPKKPAPKIEPAPEVTPKNVVIEDVPVAPIPSESVDEETANENSSVVDETTTSENDASEPVAVESEGAKMGGGIDLAEAMRRAVEK